MIYLDSAATSLLKPPEVAEAAARAIEECASPGRGSHAAAMRGAEIVYECRETAAAMFGVPKTENVVFAMNATHGLNIAIATLVGPGTRVLVSGYEHNAVMRPLYALGADIEIAAVSEYDPDLLLVEFRRKIPRAQVVVCTHVSNVFGYVLPIEGIAEACRDHGVPLIVDAAQSAGVLPLHFSKLGAEFIAMPGHKGLLGPQGTGLLLCRGEARPLLCGGTGSRSEDAAMPPELPDRLEAGTHNVCGIAGLLAGLRWLKKQPPGAIARRESALIAQLKEGFARLEGFRVFPQGGANGAGVLSVLPLYADCEELAFRLGEAGAATRAGQHCAPLAHKTVGTLATGTLRLSVSPFNTPEEIEEFFRLLKKISMDSYSLVTN